MHTGAYIDQPLRPFDQCGQNVGRATARAVTWVTAWGSQGIHRTGTARDEAGLPLSWTQEKPSAAPVKPVALVADASLDCSARREIVLDGLSRGQRGHRPGPRRFL